MKKQYSILLALCAATPLLTGVGLPGFAPASMPAFAQDHCAVGAPADGIALAAQADRGDNLRGVHALADGTGVTVAVIDTGVAPSARLGEVVDGGDLIGGQTALYDCDAHGTVVAGIIAARDTGDGIVGIAPQARIVAVRQTSSRQNSEERTHAGTVSSMSEGIHRALDHGAQVINLSVVSCVDPAAPIDFEVLEQALARAEAEQAIVVAAAGNEATHCPRGSQVVPASFPTVIAVTAHDDPHRQSDYALDAPGGLSAPGYVPAGLTGDTLSSGLFQGAGISYFEGTSFAAPVVSGLAALLRQRYPQLPASQLREMLVATADPSTGAVNAQRVIEHLPEGPVDARERSIIPATVRESSLPKKVTLFGIGALMVVGCVLFSRGLARHHRLDDWV